MKVANYKVRHRKVAPASKVEKLKKEKGKVFVYPRNENYGLF